MNFKILILFLALFLSPGLLPANEQPMPGNARAMAMSGAYNAIDADVNSLAYNPAGLATLSQMELTASYSLLSPGLTDHSKLSNGFFALGVPIQQRRFGVMAMAYNEFSLLGEYQEKQTQISYARNIFSGLYGGVSLRRYSSSVTPDAYLRVDPLYLNHNVNIEAYNADLGALYKINEHWLLGATIKNIFVSKIGIQSDDTMERSYRFGSSYRHSSILGALEYFKINGIHHYALGAEKTWRKHFALRSGAELATKKAVITYGLGYELKKIRLDYSMSFMLSGVDPGAGSHWFSISMKFGKEATGSAAGSETKETAIKTPKEKFKQALKTLQKFFKIPLP